MEEHAIAVTADLLTPGMAVLATEGMVGRAMKVTEVTLQVVLRYVINARNSAQKFLNVIPDRPPMKVRRVGYPLENSAKTDPHRTPTPSTLFGSHTGTVHGVLLKRFVAFKVSRC